VLSLTRIHDHALTHTQSVRLLWTSDQPEAETSTCQYTTLTKDQHPSPLDDWLTVHRGISLVYLQLDAQNSYLLIYNTFIKILYMFQALPCSSSGGLRRNCIYAASGIFLNRCTRQSPADSDDTPEAAYIQLRRRPPEDEQGNA
jgi:hypothetical protein